MILRLLLSLTAIFHTTVHAQNWLDYYTIESIAVPPEYDPQIGGLHVLSNQKIALAFHDGNIAIYDPKNQNWSRFASGLHEPLGILEEKTGALVVTQVPELTRLIDKDGDGKADVYQTISDDFGLTGNYHEFTFGPTRDRRGNYYISLNVASNFAGVYKKIRGEYSALCPPKEYMETWYSNPKAWAKKKRAAGRMFSCAPYRGWILKITPDGKTLPYALGLRSPNGLLVDTKNRLWATDNQGDWIGTSPLHHIKRGDFLGHPASLAWKDGWDKKPAELEPKDIQHLRKPAAALFPQGELANSPTQPIETIAPKLFGLPKNELLIGDMNQSNLIRFLPDKVKGVVQGTLIPFISGEQMGIGNNRLSFSADGKLWVGKTHLKWAGDQGLRKITWKGKDFLKVTHVKQIKNGFAIHFNQALADLPTDVTITSHTYLYHNAYGSEKIDLKTLPVLKSKLSKGNKMLSISVASLEEQRLYTIDLIGAKNKTDEPLMGDTLRYNLIKRRH